MKINDRIVGAIMALVIAGGATAGAVAFVSGAAPEPAAVVETVAATDLDALPDTNGLAAEQEVAAAAAEAERIAAEAAAAEAARVAAEQAAAAEAQRIADEQAAAEAEAYEAETFEQSEPVPAPEPAAPACPEGYVDDPNRGCHSPICEVKADGTQVPCQF